MKRTLIAAGALAAGLGLAATGAEATAAEAQSRTDASQVAQTPAGGADSDAMPRRTPTRPAPRQPQPPRGRITPPPPGPPPSLVPPPVVAPPTATPTRPQRERVRRPPEPLPPRRPPELHPLFPIKRPPRETIVRRRREHDRVPPLLFLPPVVFPGIVIPDWRHGYVRDRLTWADAETIYREEGWVEFVLDVNARGRKLWFDVGGGRVRIDWAEIVFDNGQSQVVDFAERSIGPGLYVLLDFPDGRRVDRVRMVAEAASREVRLTLRMEQ